MTLNTEQKKNILESSGFKCRKCGFYSPTKEGLEINKQHNEVLCSVCNIFAPEEAEKFAQYLNEKLEWQMLESFRNSGTNKASHSPHKQGMLEKSKAGKLVARPPYGYFVKKGELIEDEETSENVRLIFKEFLEGKSLNQIAKTYGISINGIKKILKNFTYLGKIRFDSQVTQGTHKALISPELFNQVQKKIEQNSKKKKVEDIVEISGEQA